MAKNPKIKYCPWYNNSPGFSEPCSKNCALWIYGRCAFAWQGLCAREQLAELKRKARLFILHSNREDNPIELQFPNLEEFSNDEARRKNP